MTIPTVAGIRVGFYRKHGFFEFDCPWCGKVHVALIREDAMAPFVMKVPCGKQKIKMTGFYPMIVSTTK